MKIAHLLLATLLLQGCNKTPDPLPPAHRFELLPDASDQEMLAFDTTTGQLCRNWDWKYPSTTVTPAPAPTAPTAAPKPPQTGKEGAYVSIADRLAALPAIPERPDPRVVLLTTLPTCIDLYKTNDAQMLLDDIMKKDGTKK